MLHEREHYKGGKKPMKAKGKAPPGHHRMPDGAMMKDADMPMRPPSGRKRPGRGTMVRQRST